MFSRAPLLLILMLPLALLIPTAVASAQTATPARNPIIWADVPDLSVIRVGDVYYMTSTTMHMSPGVPVMRSENLVDWEIVSYAYDTLADTDALTLSNGQDAYGRGSWASSIRYNDGTFYVVTFSYSTGDTHVYRTDDIEAGAWTESRLGDVYHDPSLLFDDDGRTYLVYGAGDISVIELTADATAVMPGAQPQVIIPDAGAVAGSDLLLGAEGSHIHKIDGTYYLTLITWPSGGGRTELVYRADSITGPWEGRVALQDDGIAQGGLVDTPDGDWYALLFRDAGAVGRIPYLVPVTWQDRWPVFGIDGQVPDTLDIPSTSGAVPPIVTSDDFEGTDLALEWQWNHNPDDQGWSLTERPGFLRLTTTRVDSSMVDTRNTLTQRTFGPQSAAAVTLDSSGMRDGDTAGLGLLQEDYGFVGVRMSGGEKALVMVNASSGSAQTVETVPLDQDVVHLATEANFENQTDTAEFFYSLDGAQWEPIGDTLPMSYELTHFMGYRFALFDYASQTAGGSVDFDDFLLGTTLDDLDGVAASGADSAATAGDAGGDADGGDADDGATATDEPTVEAAVVETTDAAPGTAGEAAASDSSAATEDGGGLSAWMQTLVSVLLSVFGLFA